MRKLDEGVVGSEVDGVEAGRSREGRERGTWYLAYQGEERQTKAW
jgi:hypothetical protein